MPKSYYGGFTFAEDGNRDVSAARILWSAELDPTVLTVNALPASDSHDLFDLAPFASRAFVVAGPKAEHVAITAPGICLRLDVLDGSVCEGPVLLQHLLVGVEQLRPKLHALRQLAALCRTGHSLPRSGRADPRLSRLILALRAMDGRAQGATLREIAAGLGGVNVDELEWPGPAESHKSNVRRLVALGHAMQRGGPKAILARRFRS